jgi:ferredoxin
MDIEIDTKLCKAYANCTFEAPDVFEVDETTGKARLLLDSIGEHRRGEVESAAMACPVQAITVGS